MSNYNFTYLGPETIGHYCTFKSLNNEQFKIDTIENAIGMPGVMIIFVKGEPLATFTFSTPYLNKSFEFIDNKGDSYTGTVNFGKVYLE